MIQFWSLHAYRGPVSYDQAHKLQLRLVDLRARDLIPDTVLFLEHSPVITRGRGLQFSPSEDPARPRRMPLPPMIPAGIEVRDIERGGDLTFHEPGQLVVYPICKLGDASGFAPQRDVAGFLRRFETIVIDALKRYGLAAHSRENATGVWIDRAPKPAGKIASIGIAVRKWVTYHGIAINAVNKMDGFQLISPCGYSPETMVRLKDLVSVGGDWREKLELAIARGMTPSASVTPVDIDEAFIAYLASPQIGATLG